MEPEFRTVVFIPVRGGSKSIPLKNIKQLLNRPLVYWVLDAAVNCKYVDKVFVSTDSTAIKNVVMTYKDNLKNYASKLTCIDRSVATAVDTASTELAMLEFASKYYFENIILIQATNPLLTTKDLENAIKYYLDNNYDSLLSVVNQKRFIWEAQKDIVVAQNYNPFCRPRRQEFKGFMVENGSFYITKRDLLLHSGCRISGRIGYYEMPSDSYFELDEPEDWIILEGLMKKRVKQNLKDNDLDKIKLVAMDCDGVLTDGGMYYSQNGDELKKFNTRDGMGIRLLHEKGIKTAIITGEDTKIVERRARKLGIDYFFLGVQDKVKVLDVLLQTLSISLDQVAYIGDDINDIPVLKKVGLSFTVNDAMQSVKDVVDYTTLAKGGQGAVREVAEIILKNKKKKVYD